MFSISITHNSKIKELSDENKVMETELLKAKQPFVSWVPQFLSYELWKMRYELWKLMNQTPPKKQYLFLQVSYSIIIYLGW